MKVIEHVIGALRVKKLELLETAKIWEGELLPLEGETGLARFDDYCYCMTGRVAMNAKITLTEKIMNSLEAEVGQLRGLESGVLGQVSMRCCVVRC